MALAIPWLGLLLNILNILVKVNQDSLYPLASANAITRKIKRRHYFPPRKGHNILYLSVLQRNWENICVPKKLLKEKWLNIFSSFFFLYIPLPSFREKREKFLRLSFLPRKERIMSLSQHLYKYICNCTKEWTGTKMQGKGVNEKQYEQAQMKSLVQDRQFRDKTERTWKWSNSSWKSLC